MNAIRGTVLMGVLAAMLMTAGGSTGAQPIDYFTEDFSADDLDLEYCTLTFRPIPGPDGYNACIEPAVTFPVPPGGTVLTLEDDDSEQISLSATHQAMLYSVTYTTIYVGSNGYITFTEADDDWGETLADHFRTPRISPYFDDLNPSGMGSVWFQEFRTRWW